MMRVGEHFAGVVRCRAHYRGAERNARTRRWRSGCAGAVWRHTDGLLSTTAMPCGTSGLPAG